MCSQDSGSAYIQSMLSQVKKSKGLTASFPCDPRCISSKASELALCTTLILEHEGVMPC